MSVIEQRRRADVRIDVRFAKRLALYCCMAIMAVSASYCSSFNMFGTDTDAQLGKQMDEQIRANPKEYPILNNPQIKQYLQGMVNEIIQSPEVKYRGTFPYQVEVINDDKTINAFCTPGGYIYVYTGLMKFLDNEATLAGVLGHEVAHAEARHGTSRMTKQYGAQVLLGVVLGQNPSQLAQIGANLFTGLALLKNGRADETQSDDLSFRYLRSTKWYPGGAVFFFEKILQQQGGSRGDGFGLTIERLMSTHPLAQDRVDAMKQRVAGAQIPAPTENNLFAQRYAQIKRSLN